MPKFKKHYTRDEARQLLPEIRDWLDELTRLRGSLQRTEEEVSAGIGLGDDLGGEMINNYVRALAKTKTVLNRFIVREIQIKDLDRGLIDFPAFVGGEEVFLCWERGEDDIEFWHTLQGGFAAREKL
jgi:hypothetical protein